MRCGIVQLSTLVKHNKWTARHYLGRDRELAEKATSALCAAVRAYRAWRRVRQAYLDEVSRVRQLEQDGAVRRLS